MKAIARNIRWDQVPTSIGSFISEGQTNVSARTEYVVFAVSVYKGISFFLVLDDSRSPSFIPSWMFETTCNLLPADWLCSVALGQDVELVLGPVYVSRDLAAYLAMIDLEPQSVEEFWRHVKLSEDSLSLSERP